MGAMLNNQMVHSKKVPLPSTRSSSFWNGPAFNSAAQVEAPWWSLHPCGPDFFEQCFLPLLADYRGISLAKSSQYIGEYHDLYKLL